jgi:hypothetical protein
MQIVATLAALTALVLVFESWTSGFAAEPAERDDRESQGRDRAR